MLIAVEERESRILSKSQTDGSDEEGDPDIDEDKDDVEEENVPKPKGSSKSAKRREMKVEKEKVGKAKGLSEYEKRRQRNIEENKKILAGLKKQYPIRGLEVVETVESPSNKNVIDKALLNDVTGDAAAALQSSSITLPNDTVKTHDSNLTNNTVTVHPANETRQPGLGFQEPSTVTAEQTTPGGQANYTAKPADETAHPANNSLANVPKIPTPLPSPPGPPHNTEKVASPSSVIGSGDNEVVDTLSTVPKVPTPCSALPHNTETNASPSGVNGSGDEDVIMEDTILGVSTSVEFQNDKDLPAWLNRLGMIGYLRGVTEDMAWQNLVTHFVAFEKQQPPIGVSSPFLILQVLGGGLNFSFS